MIQSQQTPLSTIPGITERIIQRHRPRRVVLFGSHAWGKPHKDSDVDLLVVTDTSDTRATAREIDASLYPRVIPIDIMVATPQSIEERKRSGDFFVKKVFSEGKILYDENG